MSTINGTGASDSVGGTSGNDLIEGQGGQDTIDGGAGNDTIRDGFFPRHAVQPGTGTTKFTGTNGGGNFSGAVASVDGPVFVGSGSGSTGYVVGDGDGGKQHAHAYTREVPGARIRLNWVCPTERLTILIDGVTQDLNEVVRNGHVGFEPGTAHALDSQGRIIGTATNAGDPSVNMAILTILRPFTTVALDLAGPGDGVAYEIAVNTNASPSTDPETLRGGDGADVVCGDAGTDRIERGAGNDSILFKGGGNSTLFGGTGNDTLVGGVGADSLVCGNGSDSFLFIEGHQTATIQSGEGGTDFDALVFYNWLSTTGVTVTFSGLEQGRFAYQGGGATGSFTQIEGIRGSAYADTIDGVANTAAMTVDGGGGANVIDGGSGNDALSGVAGNDTIFGGDGSDFIDSWNGSDLTFGGAGNDTITPSTGADMLYGDSGSDRFEIWDYVGAVSIFGGTEADTLAFMNWQSQSGAFVTFTGNGAGTYSHFAGATTGTFAEIEGIQGTAFADNIDGSGTGTAMQVDAGGGADSVVGGSGNDTLSGGSCNDSLLGGSGSDSLTGGAGKDRFIFSNGFGADTIEDFDILDADGDGWTDGRTTGWMSRTTSFSGTAPRSAMPTSRSSEPRTATSVSSFPAARRSFCAASHRPILTPSPGLSPRVCPASPAARRS